MQTTNINIIGVKVEKTHEDRLGSFSIDAGYNPTAHARTYGTVAMPTLGFTFGWQMEDDFFKIGDEVHFWFDALQDSPCIEIDGNKVYMIHVNQIYVRVRDGVITPRNGKALVEPYYGEGVEEVEVAGVKTMARISGGLVVSMDVAPDERIATIHSLGGSLSHESPLDLKPGDLVYRDKATNYAMDILGKTLFCLDQNLIMGKYEQG